MQNVPSFPFRPPTLSRRGTSLILFQFFPLPKKQSRRLVVKEDSLRRRRDLSIALLSWPLQTTGLLPRERPVIFPSPRGRRSPWQNLTIVQRGGRCHCLQPLSGRTVHRLASRVVRSNFLESQIKRHLSCLLHAASATSGNTSYLRPSRRVGSVF